MGRAFAALRRLVIVLPAILAAWLLWAPPAAAEEIGTSLPGAPSKPVIVGGWGKCVHGGTETDCVTISFAPPADNGGPEIERYIISISNGLVAYIPSATAGNIQVQLVNLRVPDSQGGYRFRV